MAGRPEVSPGIKPEAAAHAFARLHSAWNSLSEAIVYAETTIGRRAAYRWLRDRVRGRGFGDPE
jgi:hypothetical protein